MTRKTPVWAPDHRVRSTDLLAADNIGWLRLTEGRNPALAVSVVRSPHPDEGGPSKRRVHHVIVALLDDEAGTITELPKYERASLNDKRVEAYLDQLREEFK